jgi:hypothetical protein
VANPVPAGSDVSSGTYRCTNCDNEIQVESRVTSRPVLPAGTENGRSRFGRRQRRRPLSQPRTARNPKPIGPQERGPILSATYLRELDREREEAFLVDRFVASFRSATKPVGSLGRPASWRSFAAISEISSGL